MSLVYGNLAMGVGRKEAQEAIGILILRRRKGRALLPGILLFKFFLEICCPSKCLIELSFVSLSLLRLTSLEYY